MKPPPISTSGENCQNVVVNFEAEVFILYIVRPSRYQFNHLQSCHKVFSQSLWKDKFCNFYEFWPMNSEDIESMGNGSEDRSIIEEDKI